MSQVTPRRWRAEWAKAQHHLPPGPALFTARVESRADGSARAAPALTLESFPVLRSRGGARFSPRPRSPRETAQDRVWKKSAPHPERLRTSPSHQARWSRRANSHENRAGDSPPDRRLAPDTLTRCSTRSAPLACSRSRFLCLPSDLLPFRNHTYSAEPHNHAVRVSHELRGIARPPVLRYRAHVPTRAASKLRAMTLSRRCPTPAKPRPGRAECPS